MGSGEPKDAVVISPSMTVLAAPLPVMVTDDVSVTVGRSEAREIVPFALVAKVMEPPPAVLT